MIKKIRRAEKADVPKALPMRAERAGKPIPKPPKPRKLTTAAQVQYLHDRITMLATRLESRTPGGTVAQLGVAARELQRRADALAKLATWIEEAVNVSGQRFERLSGELNMLRQRVEGIYPLLMPKPAPEPAKPNGTPDDAKP